MSASVFTACDTTYRLPLMRTKTATQRIRSPVLIDTPPSSPTGSEPMRRAAHAYSAALAHASRIHAGFIVTLGPTLALHALVRSWRQTTDDTTGNAERADLGLKLLHLAGDRLGDGRGRRLHVALGGV